MSDREKMNVMLRNVVIKLLSIMASSLRYATSPKIIAKYTTDRHETTAQNFMLTINTFNNCGLDQFAKHMKTIRLIPNIFIELVLSIITI